MPKSKFYLPLFFRKSRYFYSKRITAMSFIVIGLIYFRVIKILNGKQFSIVSENAVQFKNN